MLAGDHWTVRYNFGRLLCLLLASQQYMPDNPVHGNVDFLKKKNKLHAKKILYASLLLVELYFPPCRVSGTHTQTLPISYSKYWKWFFHNFGKFIMLFKSFRDARQCLPLELILQESQNLFWSRALFLMLSQQDSCNELECDLGLTSTCQDFDRHVSMACPQALELQPCHKRKLKKQPQKIEG